MNPDAKRRVQFQQFKGMGPMKFTGQDPDIIFQGAFDEMHRADGKTDPKVLASSLGFTSVPTMTRETGCEIDVHFLDHTTAEVGLNNYVYTLVGSHQCPFTSETR